MFLRIHQCIPHHSPPCHSDICIWPHFVLTWDPCPLEPSGGSLWWCLLYNVPAPQIFCQCFGCTTWALNKIKHRMKNPGTRRTNNSNNSITQKSFIVVPYYAGLSENIQNIGRKFGVQVHCKGGTTIKNLLMVPKDKDPMLKQSGVIYRYHCDRVDCDEEYIGESSRTFGERFKEYLKPPSLIYDHSNISGHNVSINNFKIVGRKDLNQMRAIKEAIYIRVNDPSLNRNVGKYHCHMYGMRFWLTSQNSN